MIDKKRGLGRGLDSLLASSDWLKREDIQLFYCPIDRLIPNPYQPRQSVEDPALEELVASIREKGVLQPILVSRTDTPDQYQILAGERRWTAATRAGLTELPVLLREATSAEAIEIALIENIQRRDLNCIEEAIAYQKLQQEFNLTQEAIANRVGKNRATVANLLRILHLSSDIQEDLLNERLTMGHARALLGLEDPDVRRSVRDLIVARGLSVRQTERLIAQRDRPAKPEATPDLGLTQLQENLTSHLGAPVSLKRRGQKGTITITFATQSDLDQLLGRLGLPSQV